MKFSNLKSYLLALVLLLGASEMSMAQGAGEGAVRSPNLAAELDVPLYKSRILSLGSPISRISVGNPDIADLLLLRSSELYVLGKDLGTTNVLLWDSEDRLVAHELMPNEAIEIRSAQRSIILSGTVSSPSNMTAAVAIAEGFLAQVATAKEKEMFEAKSRGGEEGSGRVINLMQVGGAQQVMLEVKVAEISRTEFRKFNMRFHAMLNSSRWTTGNPPLGPMTEGFAPNDLFIEDKGFFGSLLTRDFLFNVTLEAAKENGLAKILAEPNLTTLSGQEAKSGENNSVTVEFKDFGVGVGFLPVVLGDGRINMVLNVSVSEISTANTVAVGAPGVSSNFVIPSLAQRSANATVELKDGQTIAIAGLLNENMREVINKFPGLGDLPILGHLFRSQDYVKGETELVILVTPHLAKPVTPDKIKLPTDSFVEPSDVDFYLLGRMEGRNPPEQNDGGTKGDFGHDVD
jgi:pilus assembly protein CpaC